MNEVIQKYLSGYFHDSIFTDAHYDHASNTLTLSLQCYREWESYERWQDAAYTYRLHFEGICHQVLETEIHGSWMDMMLITGEIHSVPDKSLFRCTMLLNAGYAEILCRDIRLERAAGELAEPEYAPAAAPKPLSGAELLVQLSRLENGEDSSVRTMIRLDSTLRTMADNRDSALPALLRRILALPRPICLRTAVRLLGECGTAEDLPLLYAHLPRTASHPETRRVLLNAIDTLSGQSEEKEK